MTIEKLGTPMLILGLLTVATGAVMAAKMSTQESKKKIKYIVGIGLSVAVLGGTFNFIK